MKKFIKFGNNVINRESISRIFSIGEHRDDCRIVLIMTTGERLQIQAASMEIMNQLLTDYANQLVAVEYPFTPLVYMRTEK